MLLEDPSVRGARCVSLLCKSLAHEGTPPSLHGPASTHVYIFVCMFRGVFFHPAMAENPVW